MLDNKGVVWFNPDMVAHEILWADDQPEWNAEILKPFIEGRGHRIVEIARSVDEVQKFVKTDKVATLGIFDANMPNKGDGERAAAIFREHRPEAIVASFSTQPQKWGDYNWDKNMSLTEILDTIDNVRPLESLE
jgi:hypothetical protein